MRMAKRKAAINIRGSLGAPALPQTRLLRSRKRKCPCDETDDVQATLHQQGNYGKNTPALSSTVTVVVTPLPSPQSSPLQKCAMMIDQQNEPAQQSCLTKPHGSSNEKQTEGTNEAEDIHLTNMAVIEEEKATVTEPTDDSQLEHLNKHSDDDINRTEKNKEEKAAEECKRSPDQTSTDQCHVLMLVSEDSDGSSAAALKNLERNQKNSPEDSGMISITDVKQGTKESAAGLPAKKKQRMGVCGLTEKERHQMLLIQNRENGEKGMKRGDICNDTAEPVIMSPSLSIPASSVIEQSGAEPKLQSSHSGETDRINEVHTTVTASDGTRTVNEGKGDIAPDPEQTEPDTPAEKAGVEGLGNQLLEFKGPTVKIMAEKLDKQTVEDGSAEVNHKSDITFHASQKKEEVSQDATEAAQLQVITVTSARDEKEEKTGDAVGGDRAGECASPSVNQSGGEVCEVTVTPSFSERKHSCEADAEPAAGSSSVSTDDTQTKDPFGSGSLDYVSDSQLNTIVLIEEVKEPEQKKDSSDCCIDATDLIRGLIRELSSLNRRVMAAHRELDSLRRSSKGSRSSVR